MARRVANLLALAAAAAAAAAKGEVLRSLRAGGRRRGRSGAHHGDRGVERANRERRDGAREPDAAAAGAQGRLLPVPRAGASREGGVPVALRLADDLG